MLKSTQLLVNSALLHLVVWCFTSCGIITPFTEEDWEKIFKEERNNYLYAVDFKDGGRINILQIDDNTGTLTFKEKVLTSTNSNLTSAPAGTVLFASRDAQLTFFSVNNSGSLTPSAPYPRTDDPVAIILDISEHFLYYFENKMIYPHLYDKSTPALTSLPTHTPEVAGLPVNILGATGGVKDNRLYVGVNSDQNRYYINTYAINPQDGTISSAALATSASLDVVPQKMCIHPSGRFLYIGNGQLDTGNQIEALRINGDGSVTCLASYTIINSNTHSLGGMAIDPAGRYLFATAQDPDNPDLVCIFTIDNNTGLLAHCQKYSLGEKNLRCLATDPWGRYLYVSPSYGKEAIYMFKIYNGALTQIAGSPFVYDTTSLDYQVECLHSLSRKL